MTDPLSSTTVAAGGGGLLALLAALGKWLLGREVDRLDKTLAEHSAAVAELRADHVGQDAIDRLMDKFDISITRIGDKLEGKLDAVHSRIDQLSGLPPRK